MMEKKENRREERGFTLIEIIVAVGIFSIVMLIAVGALLSVIGANRNARATETVVNNLNFALESMTREIRVGTNYHCGSGNVELPQDCAGSGGFFAFEKSGGDPNDPNDQVIFKLENGRIHKSDKGNSPSSFLPITSPGMTVTNLRFYVYGASDDVGNPVQLQPRVVIVASGEIEGSSGEVDTFNVQTTVTQRLLD